MRILFASSEAYPLVKTGGLADVSGALPGALGALGHDVRLVLPAYRAALAQVRELATRVSFELHGRRVDILETTLPGAVPIKTFLVNCPPLFDRPGTPYHDERGADWPDNAARFLLYNRVVAALALDRCALDWAPDIAHCNDWQTGLVPALLTLERPRPATVFTIHNIAYQGLFSRDEFIASGLPEFFWNYQALEFHSFFSFIKGGIVYADRLNTVSPNYAAEIQTERFGHGLDGLLRHRHRALGGILNGIDTDLWNPASDSHLAQPYDVQTLALKTRNKLALQAQLGLPQDERVPLIGSIGRLVEQKGIDLLLAAFPQLLARPAQVALLGSGQREFEQALRALAAAHPQHMSVTFGYDEALAHRIEAGADLFLMPSRFEPCGLNQLYSLRYGTVPVVHRVGGLADTVIEHGDNANGFVFETPTPTALLDAMARAFDACADTARWRTLQRNGMGRDHSWRASALAYQTLYEDALLRAGRV